MCVPWSRGDGGCFGFYCSRLMGPLLVANERDDDKTGSAVGKTAKPRRVCLDS